MLKLVCKVRDSEKGTLGVNGRGLFLGVEESSILRDTRSIGGAF